MIAVYLPTLLIDACTAVVRLLYIVLTSIAFGDVPQAVVLYLWCFIVYNTLQHLLHAECDPTYVEHLGRTGKNIACLVVFGGMQVVPSILFARSDLWPCRNEGGQIVECPDIGFTWAGYWASTLIVFMTEVALAEMGAEAIYGYRMMKRRWRDGGCRRVAVRDDVCDYDESQSR